MHPSSSRQPNQQFPPHLRPTFFSDPKTSTSSEEGFSFAPTPPFPPQPAVTGESISSSSQASSTGFFDHLWKKSSAISSKSAFHSHLCSAPNKPTATLPQLGPTSTEPDDFYIPYKGPVCPPPQSSSSPTWLSDLDVPASQPPSSSGARTVLADHIDQVLRHGSLTHSPQPQRVVFDTDRPSALPSHSQRFSPGGIGASPAPALAPLASRTSFFTSKKRSCRDDTAIISDSFGAFLSDSKPTTSTAHFQNLAMTSSLSHAKHIPWAPTNDDRGANLPTTPRRNSPFERDGRFESPLNTSTHSRNSFARHRRSFSDDAVRLRQPDKLSSDRIDFSTLRLPSAKPHTPRSPTYVDGPIFSIPPPDRTQEGRFLRPQLDRGLPTAYRHHRPPSELFAAKQQPAHLPKAMLPQSWNHDSLLASPKIRPRKVSTKPSLPKFHTQVAETDSCLNQDQVFLPARNHYSSFNEPDVKGVDSGAPSIHTSISTDILGRTSSGNTSMTSLKTQPSTLYDQVFKAGGQPKPRTPQMETLKPSVFVATPATQGPSRPPPLSPIASSGLRESSDEMPNHDSGQPEASSQTYLRLQQLHKDELYWHSVQQSGYLEPNNGCESVFLPRPRLRARTKGKHPRERTSLGEAVGERQIQNVQSNPNQAPIRSEVIADLRRLPSNSTSQAAHSYKPSQLDTSGGPSSWSYRLEPATRSDSGHNSASHSVAYGSDSEASTASKSKPFFHHRMPPPPPSQHHQRGTHFKARSGPQTLVGVGDGVRSQDAASDPVTSAPIGSLTFHDSVDQDDDKEEELQDDALDLQTVLERGRTLDRERKQWRNQHQRSLNGGRSSFGLWGSSSHRQSIGSERHHTQRPILSHVFNDFEQTPKTVDSPSRSIWRDPSTGRTYMITELDSDTPRATATRDHSRFSKSTPNLTSLNLARESERLSSESQSSVQFCKPFFWGLPKSRPKALKPIQSKKSEKAISSTDSAPNLISPSTLKTEPPSHSSISALKAVGRDQRREKRTLVSDEPVIIQRKPSPVQPPSWIDTHPFSVPSLGRPFEPNVASPPRSYLNAWPVTVPQSCDQEGEGAVGSSNGGLSTPNYGVAMSSPSEEPGSWISSDDSYFGVESPTKMREHRTSLPPGRYPTRGYHRPRNSDDLRAQLRQSHSLTDFGQSCGDNDDRTDLSWFEAKNPRPFFLSLPLASNTSVPVGRGDSPFKAYRYNGESSTVNRGRNDTASGDDYDPIKSVSNTSLPVPPWKKPTLRAGGGDPISGSPKRTECIRPASPFLGESSKRLSFSFLDTSSETVPTPTPGMNEGETVVSPSFEFTPLGEDGPRKESKDRSNERLGSSQSDYTTSSSRTVRASNPTVADAYPNNYSLNAFSSLDSLANSGGLGDFLDLLPEPVVGVGQSCPRRETDAPNRHHQANTSPTMTNGSLAHTIPSSLASSTLTSKRAKDTNLYTLSLHRIPSQRSNRYSTGTMSRASSELADTEIWDANNVSVENLFFRPLS